MTAYAGADRIQEIATGMVGTVEEVWALNGRQWLRVRWDPSVLQADEVESFSDEEEERSVREHLQRQEANDAG